MTEQPLLCPFDKNPCIKYACAVWLEEREACSFSSLPDMVRALNMQKEVTKTVPVRKDPEPSGSGKYRTLLFD